ncbi:MAG: glycosyltransferase [Gammaproteobacteria bacterium]|nr:glycosyltransferase [Gammaproteobacteria bacterium]MBU1624041.1 glycosyltransferase [Gammaproteobacteria bacterium]MBU1981769.1 glycosyltransferase [Gammaproteobacteria bacterium]
MSLDTRHMAQVSVIIPCYCCADTIAYAVESVLAQTLLPSQLVLVDDCSPDHGATQTVLHKLKSRYSDRLEIALVTNSVNLGAASARNAGWDMATQPYVAFLDADDAWHPEKIRIQYRWMEDHPEYGLSGHQYSVHMDRGSQWPQLSEEINVRTLTRFRALLSNPFATPTVMLKREVPFRFEKGKRYTEDYLLWLLLILSGTRSVRLNVALAATFKASFGANGLSSDLWKMEWGELEAYWKTYRCKLIGLSTILLLIPFSLAKYIRREIVVVIRRVTRRGD